MRAAAGGRSFMTTSPWPHSARRRWFSRYVQAMIGTICVAVLLFQYGKIIIVSMNRVFDASSIKDLDDSPGNQFSYTGFKPKLPAPNENKSNSSMDLSIASANHTTKNKDKIAEADPAGQNLRFYILPSPDISEILELVFKNRTKLELLEVVSEYYRNALNEESAEMWLHRGFQRLHAQQTTTKNKREADVYVVAGYFHLFRGLLPASMSWAQEMVPKFYRNIVIDPTKPHLILTPTWNPTVSRKIGLRSLASTLQLQGVSASNLWSVGFERNTRWQPVPLVSQILPIPYVTDQAERKIGFEVKKNATSNTPRRENSVFFAGDPRKNANQWAGCSRSDLIDSLKEKLKDDTLAHTDLQLLGKKHRMSQSTHHERMQTSEYCLVLCGDTPTSRTLTAAVVEGCIPVRVGSRWRGLCDPPCHKGFGWEVTGPDNPHMPFEERISWEIFPEIDEAGLLSRTGGGSSSKTVAETSSQILQSMFQQKHGALEKKQLQNIMGRVRSGFIYGYGDPVVSEDFGDAALYVWESFVAALQKKADDKS